MQIINIIAIIVTPIVAVVVGQWLQNRALKRQDKMNIFKILMIARVYGWTPDSVDVLNKIDIVFAGSKLVRAVWKDLFDKLSVENPDDSQLKKMQDANYKLLEAMAADLEYKDKITWEIIQTPYIPIRMTAQRRFQEELQKMYASILSGMTAMVNMQKEKLMI